MTNVEEVARRLLGTLNEHQGHYREGATLHLGEQEARDAGLRPGSAVYRAAVWWLLDVGALVPNEEANKQLRNTAGAQHRSFAFKLTRHGVDLLRGA